MRSDEPPEENRRTSDSKATCLDELAAWRRNDCLSVKTRLSILVLDGDVNRYSGRARPVSARERGAKTRPSGERTDAVEDPSLSSVDPVDPLEDVDVAIALADGHDTHLVLLDLAI